MRFEQLHYFEAAVRAGSLRKASIELGLSQPTLTQQIQRLEEELNVVLFFRQPTGVVLTEAGEALLPHIRQALAAENGLLQEAGALVGMHRGRLRLGAIPLAGQLFLPEAVRRFRDSYPGIEFRATEAGSSRVRQGLVSGEFDLGVLATWGSGTASDELLTEELTGGVYTLCVPRNHRLASAERVRVGDVAGESFIVVEPGQMLREIFDRIAAEVPVSVVYQTNSSASARRMVDAGVGVCLQSAVGNLGSPGSRSVAIPFDEPWAHSSLCLARRRHEQPTSAMRKFMEHVREETEPFRHEVEEG